MSSHFCSELFLLEVALRASLLLISLIGPRTKLLLFFSRSEKKLLSLIAIVALHDRWYCRGKMKRSRLLGSRSQRCCSCFYLRSFNKVARRQLSPFIYLFFNLRRPSRKGFRYCQCQLTENL